jgi:phosphoribosylglycinamide formyltransferase-1
MYNLVVFASGNGSTLQSIIDNIENGNLKAKIQLVVSNNSDAYALSRAKNSNIPTYVITNKNSAEIDEELINILSNYEIDLIVLAGYLKLIGPKLINKYTIINTHPALLPNYGGKGMYGMNVHRAVVEAHEKKSGVTLHYVNEKYDSGDIIAQTVVDVFKDDTPEDLSTRVQIAEKIQLINVLKKFSEK